MPTVLVVDEPRYVGGSVEYLEQAGFTCWAADSREGALKILREHAPDLALIEVHLSWPYRDPGEGLETLRLARRVFPNTKRCAMCVYADYRTDAEAFGAEAFVQKCGDAEKIIEALKGLLRNPSIPGSPCRPS